MSPRAARRGRWRLCVDPGRSSRPFGVTGEIAHAAVWLSSDESSFAVGHALAVDGGYLAR